MMMNKKYLMTGMAAMALAIVAGCSRDDGIRNYSDEEKVQYAQEQLGIEIDPNQDWNMTATIKASVTVNLGLDQKYTVGIYDANPMSGSNVHFYAKESVDEGGRVELAFEAPSADNSLYVAVFDSKGRYLVQNVKVVEGTMNAVFGSDVSAARTTRATEAEASDYAKTVNDFLNPTVETCAAFVSQIDAYREMVSSGALDVVDNTLSAETMHAYTAFTDADLEVQSTLSNLIYPSSSSSSTTETATYKVVAGYDPAAGESVNVMNGSAKAGTLTFGNPVAIGATEEVSFWYGALNQTSGMVFSMPNGDNGQSWKYGGASELDATHTIALNPTQACTVTIEQATTTANTLKFDGTELPLSSATTTGDRRVYTVTGVSAGTHTISMGSGESGVWKVIVTYAASSAAVSDGSYDKAWEGYNARLARSYYRFVPDVNGTFTFYHKTGASNNAITVTDNGGYLQYNGTDFHNWSWYNSDITFQNMVAGHTYEITLNTSEDGCYGVKMEYTATSGSSDPYYVGHGDGKHYRVAAGTEVTSKFHINSTYGKVNESVIYVEGKLHIGTDYTLNGVTIVVANGGELIIDGTANMSNTGRFVVMAGGKITGGNKGAAMVYNVNNGSCCYNAGTINYNGELNINGSNFYNCGTVNLDVLRNTSGGLITNFGHVTARTNMGAADAYNCTFVNACYMHYTEQAGIGHLTMLKNSRLDVDGLCEFNQSWTEGFDASRAENALAYVPANPNILMDKSVVNVGTAYVTNTVFKGPSAANEISIVKMGKVQVGNGTDLMQRDNCYFDWDITELYNKENVKYQDIPAAEKVYNPYGYLVDYYRVHITKFISEASSPVSIPAAASPEDCTGVGYNPSGQTVVVEDRPAVWSYAFEDTPYGDYDMNDVVLKVSYHYDEETKTVDESRLDITLCCSGASLSLTAYLGSQILFGGKEVHDFFGQKAGTLINTGLETDVDYVLSTIATPEGFSFADADFWIDSPVVVGGVHIAKAGQDPHGIVVPADWQWPLEYVCIKWAYPNFIEFASDASTQDETIKGWYKQTPTNPVSGKVYIK